jgi:hypothetical protein
MLEKLIEQFFGMPGTTTKQVVAANLFSPSLDLGTIGFPLPYQLSPDLPPNFVLNIQHSLFLSGNQHGEGVFSSIKPDDWLLPSQLRLLLARGSPEPIVLLIGHPTFSLMPLDVWAERLHCFTENSVLGVASV